MASIHPPGYDSALRAVGLVERVDRALVTLTGKDRAAWLHNLVTNEVKQIEPGHGRYAFAVNVKGRILFELNLFVEEEAIRLDLDRAVLSTALDHFRHYTISEDVVIDDVTSATPRFGLIGPAAATMLERFGLDDLTAMTPLQHTRIDVDGVPATVVRHDFAGLPGAELFAVQPDAGDQLAPAIRTAGSSFGLADIPNETLDTLRIEAGIPWMHRDIDETILPAETGQTERAVSYRKGCYLGQEVIERMRSRGSLARVLSGFSVEGSETPAAGNPVRFESTDVGRITSVCHSPATQSIIALGYLRSPQAKAGTTVTISTEQGEIPAVVSPLPFRRP